jgi:hypothetical protein
LTMAIRKIPVQYARHYFRWFWTRYDGNRQWIH